MLSNQHRVGGLANRLHKVLAYAPYAAVGTVTCIVAILVAEIFVQVMQPPPVEANANDLTIALLIDTSGSMKGEPIEEVQDTAIRFLETWNRPNTHIAVIEFNQFASVIEPVLMSEDPVDPLISELRRLKAGSDTALHLGLQEADEVFWRIGSSRNAVMLFTDGEPNDLRSARNKADLMRQRGTVIVAIGTANADEAFLERLTGHPNNVFTTQLGDFANAFDKAARVIAMSSFGTRTTSQGLVVVLVVSLFLAAAMLAVENVWGLRGNWWRDMWWLPVAGGIAGYLGGLVGEYLLPQVVLAGLDGGLADYLGIVTWGLVGLSCGTVLGLTDLAGSRFTGLSSLLYLPPKSRRGAVFGLVGGLVGGAVFAQFFGDVSLAATGWERQALLSRLAGFAILGFAIGLAIKVGQELLKHTWLLGLSKGFYEGQQYILAKSPVSVGRAGNNDINLGQETDIDDRVGHFELEHDLWYFVPASHSAASVVAVDKQGVTDRVQLDDGLSIRFGNTEFLFHNRERPGSVSQVDRWALAGDHAEFELPMQPLQGRILLGSDTSCDIVIRDASVAGQHAVLEFNQQDLRLTALGGFVSVNEANLPHGGQTLTQGDFIVLGAVELALVKKFDT